jgi:hypothetical protein
VAQVLALVLSAERVAIRALSRRRADRLTAMPTSSHSRAGQVAELEETVWVGGRADTENLKVTQGQTPHGKAALLWVHTLTPPTAVLVPVVVVGVVR